MEWRERESEWARARLHVRKKFDDRQYEMKLEKKRRVMDSRDSLELQSICHFLTKCSARIHFSLSLISLTVFSALSCVFTPFVFSHAPKKFCLWCHPLVICSHPFVLHSCWPVCFKKQHLQKGWHPQIWKFCHHLLIVPNWNDILPLKNTFLNLSKSALF